MIGSWKPVLQSPSTDGAQPGAISVSAGLRMAALSGSRPGALPIADSGTPRTAQAEFSQGGIVARCHSQHALVQQETRRIMKHRRAEINRKSRRRGGCQPATTRGSPGRELPSRGTYKGGFSRGPSKQYIEGAGAAIVGPRRGKRQHQAVKRTARQPRDQVFLQHRLPVF